MSEERLRLIAEFRDNASAGVRRLGRELGEVRETPGMANAKRWMGDFAKHAQSFGQAGGGISAGMGAIGLGGLVAAGGVAAAVKALKEFGEQRIALQSISRETGIAVDQLNQLKHAARDMHVDPKSMVAGVQYFAGEMEQARIGLGKLNGEMNQINPGFAKKLREEDPAAAVKDYLEWLSKIPEAQMKLGKSQADGIQLQKRWASLGFGSDDIEKLVEQGPAKLAEALAKAAQETPKTTKEMLAGAQALADSANKLDDAIERFETSAGPFIFKQLSQATDNFTAAFKEVEHVIEWFEKVKDHPFKAIADAAVSGIDDAAKRNASTEDRATRAGGPQDKMVLDLPGLASKAIHGAMAVPSLVLGDKTLRRGEFAPVKDDADRTERLAKMQADLAAADAKLKADKNPVGFPVRQADTIARTRELRDAIATMKDSGPSPVLPAIVPPPVPSNYPSTLNKLRDAMKAGVQPAPIILPPTLQPASATPVPHPVSRAPAPMVVTPASPVQPAPRPAPPPIPQPMPRVELPQPAPRPAPPPSQQPDPAMQGLFQLNAYHGEERPSLLQRTAYHEGDDESSERRGGMGSLTAEFREVIASGTKAGVMAAFRELTQERDMETTGGRGRGGIMNASFEVGGGGSAGAGARGAGGTSGGSGGAYGGGPAGHRAPSLRYNRPHENAPFKPTDDGAVPTGAHTPLKDLIAQHETGGTGAAGYGTAYGHAEQPGSKMHALAPPKPLTDMSLSEVLAYQREMKPKAGSPAFPVGRAQWTESTLRGLTRGMDPNTKFTPELQEKLFDRSIAGRMGQGAQGFRNEWDSLRGVQSGEIDAAVEGHRKAMAQAATVAPKPTLHAGDGKMPAWMDGKSQRELAGVNKGLAGDLLAASEATGQHFRVLQGLRTQAEANHNAATGRGVRNSQHLYGAAADIRLTDDKGRDLDRNDPSWNRYAQAYEAHSRASGGQGRWLGHVPGWSWDRAHFDQGIGYGEHHARDPFGVHGPTKDDVAQGNKEIFKSPDNPFLAKAHDQLASKSADALSAAHRLMKWADKASKADDPDGTPITTVDRRDPKFAPYPEPPRKSLLDEANKAGLGATTIKHEGGATIEIRGLPQSKGVKTKTSGMVTAVNLRRASPVQTG